MRAPALITLTAAAGAAGLGYVSVVERNMFRLRRYDVPVLADGARPVRVLHISDAHLTPRRRRLMSWIRTLDALDPDLVVNTGDSIAHAAAVRYFLDALGPLLERPGVFVYGSNDLYSPVPKNPARYLWRTSATDHAREVPDLPWAELGAGMIAAGWLDVNNARGRVKAGDLDIEVAGVHDSHVKRDRYEQIAGPADPAADLRLGLLHSPEPRVMDRFVADGYDLLLAGHTHGGQICLPLRGALVTNCGIEPARVSGLHRHPAAGQPALDGRRAWLHVSAGLGTSPWAPARFCCPPEATLLTLVPATGDPGPPG
ncbi:MAG TPA: metallophosphoesterase [Streptosporangiaceae bacterium]|nr:metallophosphoesterase [Streptosporangiaceae bacterium]